MTQVMFLFHMRLFQFFMRVEPFEKAPGSTRPMPFHETKTQDTEEVQASGTRDESNELRAEIAFLKAENAHLAAKTTTSDWIVSAKMLILN